MNGDQAKATQTAKVLIAPPRAILERALELLRGIEIDQNTIAYWNANVRKPGEAAVIFDPDGHMEVSMRNLSRILQNGSVHQIPRDEWLAEIQRLDAARPTTPGLTPVPKDWGKYAYRCYLDCTPAEALQYGPEGAPVRRRS